MPNKLIWTTIQDPHDAPTNPGVYVYWSGEKILYIGKAISLRSRLLSHTQNAKLDPKERAIVTGATHIRYSLTESDFFALLLESRLIKEHQPPYNMITKDDSSYLYVSLDLNEEFPKPRLVRGRDLPDKPRVRNFGPFPSNAVAEEILKSIRRLIPFCTQNGIGKRACFYSHVGLCDPCPSNVVYKFQGKEQIESRIDYRAHIKAVVRILEGNTSPVITSLTNRMTRLSRQMRYEEALQLRKKIERFQRWIDTHAFSDKRILVLDAAPDRLASLRELLVPYIGNTELKRIECYDASNLLHQHSVVSLVTLTDGRIDKSQYRRFKIKTRATSDFTRLEEALTRRFRNRWPKPDLLVVDGGKPQVRMAQKVLDRVENPPPLIGLAKAPDRLIIPHITRERTTYITVNPPTNNPGFNLLKLLRDESHRFANSYREILMRKQSGLS